MESILQGLERYGVSFVVIASFISGGGYILHRLFNAKDGLGTRLTEKHIEFLEKTAECQGGILDSAEKLSTSYENMSVEMSRRTRQLATLIEQQNDPTSVMSSASLQRSGLHACDVLEGIAKDLGCINGVQNSINSMRRELKESL